MARKTHSAAPPPAAVIGQDDEALDTSDGSERIFSRPDGYYWLAPDGKQEVGPFATLAEAESELGVADWIDAETGELAQGQSPTHLERE